MQTNHHTSATRVKVYHGRRHTKKQPHTEKPSRPFKKMKSQLKKMMNSATSKKNYRFSGSKASPFGGGREGARKVGQSLRSKIIYTHFTHFEKPPQPCESKPYSLGSVKGLRKPKKKNTCKLAGSNSFPPRRRGAEGASMKGGPTQ